MQEYREKHFESMADFAAFINENVNDKTSAHTGSHDKNFYGASFNEAIDMLEKGHVPGLTKISSAVEKLQHENNQFEQIYFWDTSGILLDIGTYCTGEPEHWLEVDMEPKRQVFKFFINIGMMGGIQTKTIFNRGAALVALIDTLQQNPANIVELTIMSYVKNSGGKRVRITIDLGTTPLDMDSVAFAMAHPAFFRRLVFSVREQIVGKPLPSGIGSTLELEADKRPDNCIYFGGGTSENIRNFNENFSTLEGAGKWVNNQVKELTKNSTNEA